VYCYTPYQRHTRRPRSSHTNGNLSSSIYLHINIWSLVQGGPGISERTRGTFFLKSHPGPPPPSPRPKTDMSEIFQEKHIRILLIFEEPCVQGSCHLRNMSYHCLADLLSYTCTLCAFVEFTMPFPRSAGIVEASKMKLLRTTTFELILG
jgi:hypothetical protein